MVWNEAVKINGADPDFHRRDLWDAIDSGDFPEWELGLQLFDEEFADSFDFDVLDATKIIPEEDGAGAHASAGWCSTACVDNFFAETEQVAFCTQNIVPGIDFTNDPLLQGRNFSYLDTQLKRLGGPNFTQIPINAPQAARSTTSSRTGTWRCVNPKGRANYEPNSLGRRAARARSRSSGFRSFPAEESGAEAARSAPETLRRPLQPGAAVLHQPDRRSSRRHIARRLRLRAEQGRDAGDPRAHGRRICSTSTRVWRERWPTACG